MKSAILFICHFINKFSLSQYNRIYNDLDTNKFDLYYCTSSQQTEKLYELKIPTLCYDNNIILVKNYYDVFKIVMYLFNSYLTNYKYIYVIEYDVYYPHIWNNLLIELNNNTSDLLCEYVKKFKYGDITEWQWTNEYYADHTNSTYGLDNNIKHYLKSCLSFFRISNDAVRFILNYNYGDLKSYIYELYVPTLLYNYGYTINSLSSVQNKDDNEFNYKSYILPEYFYYTKLFDDYKVMNKLANNQKLLFTMYKSQKN